MDKDSLLGLPATATRVRFIATHLKFSAPALQRALQLTGRLPDSTRWQKFLEQLFLFSGVALLLVGIMSFFAFNWHDLPYGYKLAIPQVLILLCVILTAWRGIHTAGGRLALLGASVFTGIALAMYGQTYQTGADPYSLFLGWAVLILPWVLIARSPGLWLLHILLLNIAFILFWIQVLHPPLWEPWRTESPLFRLLGHLFDFGLAQWLFILNVIVTLIWEGGAQYGVSWMRARSFPRIIGLIALVMILANILSLISAYSFEISERATWLSPVLYVVAMTVGLWFYQNKQRDLLMLTLLLMSAMVVVTALLIHWVIHFDKFIMFQLLFVAVVILMEVFAAVWWLRSLKRKWQFNS